MKLVPYPNGPVSLQDTSRSLPLNVGHNAFSDTAAATYLKRTGGSQSEEDCVDLILNNNLAQEEYNLMITDVSVTVEASSEQGAIWGLTTLYVLSLENGNIPLGTIKDKPVYSHRGLHIDCARHFFSYEEVKKVIEGISLAKINKLHWHLSDDQGWRIESKKFPKLQETSKNYFTQEQIKDVVKYAKERGVEVIPEIDMPGHTCGILAAYPEYGCTGEEVELATCGGIYPKILCAGKEEVYTFLNVLLSEICPLFESPYFHIGGDEAPKTAWEDCTECRAMMKKEGLSNMDDLQGYFSRRVADIIKKYGKKPICWDDSLKSHIVPDDVTIQYWNIDRKEQMAAFKGRFIYSDMFEIYIDYPASMSSLKKMYNVVPDIGGHDYSNDERLLGFEACLWTEHVDNNELFEKRIFPRTYAIAEIGWSKERDYSRFKEGVSVLLKHLKALNISALTITESDPEGKARRNETISYFEKMNSAMTPEIREKTVASAKPSKEFARRFMKKFFKATDLPFLIKYLK